MAGKSGGKPKKSGPSPETRAPVSPVVHAHVVLRGPSGKSIQDVQGQVSAENVSQFVAAPDARERAKVWLELHGLSVVRASPMSILVEADPERLEAAFGGRLKPLDPPQGSADKSAKSAKSARSAAGPSHEAAEGRDSPGYWEWAQPPSVPADVSDVISAVTLPRPVRRMG